MTRELRFPSVLGALALTVGAAACSSSSTTTARPDVAFDSFGTFNGARVEVVAEGGIAALSIRDRVDHDSRAWIHVTRHLCDRNCPAPTDSASGLAPANAIDSLFSIVLARKDGLQDDYGTTRNGADMMTYTVRISSAGSTKTIRADDGTMPTALRQVVDAVRATVSQTKK
jgi:hypothetical protein